MSIPAGLPEPRPDQGFAPPGSPMAPGSQTGIIRAREVIVSGPNGSVVGVFVYAAGTTPGAGNQPIASMTNQTSDPFGNPTVNGVDGYVSISGVLYALQLGQASFGGSPIGAFFVHNMNNPPLTDPMFGGFADPTGAVAEVFSGQAGGGSSGSAIQLQDSTSAGVANGVVNVIAGNLNFNGGLLTDGKNLNVGDGVTANVNLSPKMATPPNQSNMAAGTATLAQVNAWGNGLYQSLKNRGLFTLCRPAAWCSSAFCGTGSNRRSRCPAYGISTCASSPSLPTPTGGRAWPCSARGSSSAPGNVPGCWSRTVTLPSIPWTWRSCSRP